MNIVEHSDLDPGNTIPVIGSRPKHVAACAPLKQCTRKKTSIPSQKSSYLIKGTYKSATVW